MLDTRASVAENTSRASMFPSTWPFGHYFRGRLNPRRFTVRGKPRAFGDHESIMILRYSCQHSHFWCLEKSLSIFRRRSTERFATYLIRSLDFIKYHRFGEWLEPRYILGAIELDQWAITLSLKGGCFHKYVFSNAFALVQTISWLCWNVLFDVFLLSELSRFTFEIHVIS